MSQFKETNEKPATLAELINLNSAECDAPENKTEHSEQNRQKIDLFMHGTIFGATMKNLLKKRGSIATVNPVVVSRLGKSDHNLYRSLEAVRVHEFECMMDVQEVSDISTSRNKSCDKTQIKKFIPTPPMRLETGTDFVQSVMSDSDFERDEDNSFGTNSSSEYPSNDAKSAVTTNVIVPNEKSEILSMDLTESYHLPAAIH